MGKFKKGLILGGLLGAGLMWLGTTKKGKEVREQMFDHAGQVLEDVKKKIKQSKGWDSLTKNTYVSTVTRVVDTYAKKHNLDEKAKQMIERIVAAQWPHVRAQKAASKRKKKK